METHFVHRASRGLATRLCAILALTFVAASFGVPVENVETPSNDETVESPRRDRADDHMVAMASGSEDILATLGTESSGGAKKSDLCMAAWEHCSLHGWKAGKTIRDCTSERRSCMMSPMAVQSTPLPFIDPTIARLLQRARMDPALHQISRPRSLIASSSKSEDKAIEDLDLGSTGRSAPVLLRGMASQSSECCGGRPSRAVDGSTNQKYSRNSCTHTKNGGRPWWKLNFGSSKMVSKVQVWNRADCCNNRLNRVLVKVGSSVCGSLSSSKSVQTIMCNKKGSTVVLQQTRSDYLTLCEVQIFGSASTVPTTLSPTTTLTFSPTSPSEFNTLTPTVTPTAAPSDTCTVRKIAYSACSASSVWYNDAIGVRHGTGQLYSNDGWAAGRNRAGEWWEMDVGSIKLIGGVVTQGRTAHDQYVKSYKVHVSLDGSSWTYVDGGKVFTANTAANNNKVINKFTAKVNARYVRIVVQTWNRHISMRAAVLLCNGSAGGTWSDLFDDYYIQEHHSEGKECYDFNTAKSKCEALLDCHGIVSQRYSKRNICYGKFQVTHGSTATLVRRSGARSYKYSRNGRAYSFKLLKLKKATQSSVAFGGTAGRAIDKQGENLDKQGQTEVYGLHQQFERGSCTHTANEVGEHWWKVSLGQDYEIDKIEIWGRDSYQSRLKGTTIAIKSGRNAEVTSGACGDKTTGLLGVGYQEALCSKSSTAAIEAAGPRSVYPIGNQVFFESQNPLTLCEVKVWGRKEVTKQPKDCGPSKVSGGWKFAKSSSVEAAFSYTVGVTKTEEQAKSSSWSKTVESSMEHGWSVEASLGYEYEAGVEGVSLHRVGVELTVGGHGTYSSTNSRTSEQTKEVRNAVEQSTEISMEYTLPPGAMWQWEYTATDECGSAPIKVNHVMVTKNIGEPPCCLPGYFADPTVAHGACVAGDFKTKNGTVAESPCLAGCKKETCFPHKADPSAQTKKCQTTLNVLRKFDFKLDMRAVLKLLKDCAHLRGEQIAEKFEAADTSLLLQLREPAVQEHEGGMSRGEAVV